MMIITTAYKKKKNELDGFCAIVTQFLLDLMKRYSSIKDPSNVR